MTRDAYKLRFSFHTMAVVIVLFVFSLSSICAQYTPEARKLTEALQELQKRPNDPQVQERYLKAFPHDYQKFIQLFDLGRELSDGHDYIYVLTSLAMNHEAELGDLLVQLCKDAQWEADAPNYLQHITLDYARQHPKTYAALVGKLPPAKRASVARFLADDAEKHYH